MGVQIPVLTMFDDGLLQGVRRLIDRQKLRVLNTDPPYMCLDGADAGNPFIQGRLPQGDNTRPTALGLA